jgi:protein TonB
MFGVLLESRARRQRRTGGALASAATHLAIVAGVGVLARGPVQAAMVDKPLVVPIALPKEPPIVHARVSSRATTSSTRIVSPNVHIIDVPAITPIGLPPIVPSTGAAFDGPIAIGGGHDSTGWRGSLTDDGPGDSNEWRGTELMMRIVEQAKPRYPDLLRQAGIDGRVLLRFTVDTTGRVDPASVAVVNSTHDLFTSAARTALLAFRFRPAEVNGRHVRALAEMPFEFAIKR